MLLENLSVIRVNYYASVSSLELTNVMDVSSVLTETVIAVALS